MHVPFEWREAEERLAAAPAGWAGMPDGVAVMGIVNVTPDSFSDGGDHLDPASARAAAEAMAQTGAAILDIGGESTRPGASPVTIAEEQARVLPVIEGLRHLKVAISIDTRNASTMTAALIAGASIVNDVSALSHDVAARAVVAASACPVVLMHMRGTPETMNQLAAYDDVAREVTVELALRIAAAEAAGIRRERIAVDPGIGFAKTGKHNRELLRRLPILLNLGCRVVVGVSRKRMIGQAADVGRPKQRLPGSLAAGLFAMAHGASILRVHDVAETVQALRVKEAISRQS
ncbi:MAG: dihydropteroate synthase [Pseudomonadota bacterium]|nr:dihydropteroate synthase [Pseudomonadota bacterium]